MHLTVQTDYALRVLITLAENPDRLVRIDEIAQRFQISKNHLLKTAQVLASGGFVETVRGRGGGIRLARPADNINVGAVVRHVEVDFHVAGCFSGASCALLPACRLKALLGTAVASFLEVLDGRTLAQLL